MKRRFIYLWLLIYLLLCDGRSHLDRIKQLYSLGGCLPTGVQNETLPGVSVSVKGTTTGTVTNVNGKYTLKTPSSDATLVFSFIGI
jgi:hypothetical protein